MRSAFEFGLFSLEYEEFGDGEKPLLAFHGFGRTLDDFKVLRESILPNYRVIGVNLFLHGSSAYPAHRIDANTLTKVELIEIFTAFLDHLSIDRFSTIGYSMGGKISLCLVEQLGPRMDSVFLMAPDGIKLNPWYKFASHSPIGRSLYRGLIRFPKPYLATLNALVATGLVKEKIARFAKSHLETPEQRKQVYEVWMMMRLLNPNLEVVANSIRDNKVNLRLFFGRYDKIIPPSIGHQFVSEHDLPGNIYELDSGHNLLTSKTDLELTRMRLG